MNITEVKPPSPLISVAFAWITGLLLGFYLPLDLNANYIIYIISALFLLLCLLFLISNERVKRFAIIFILIIITGFLRSGTMLRLPPDHVSRIFQHSASITKEITVRLSGEPQRRIYPYGSSYRIYGNLLSIEDHPVQGKIILTFPESYLMGDAEDLIAGNILKTIGELAPYQNSRGFSRIPAPYFANVSAEAVTGKAKTLVYVDKAGGNISGYHALFRYRVSQLRRLLKERIENRIPAEHAPFIKAILLGNRENMGEMRDLLAQGGMAHLIAISGIHLAIITIIMLTLFKILYIRRLLSGILIIIFFIIYAELCNWSPSITRAAVMLSLIIICGFLQRKPSYNNVLAASLLIITVIAPIQIFSIGMQLSFISVFVLINIIPPFITKIRKILLSNSKLFSGLIAYRISQLFIVAFFIGIFLLPLNLYYFNQFSLNGLIGNLLGIPLLGIIIPLSLTLIFLPNIPFLLIPFQESFGFVLSIFNGWAVFSASLPLFFDFIPFRWFHILLAYALLVILFFWIDRYFLSTLQQDNSSAGRIMPKRSQRKKPLFWFPHFLMILLLGIILFTSFASGSNQLIVTLFHVGHGDLFLIETPARERIMIDTGPPEGAGINFRYAALPYLKQQGIKHLDWVIITHPHNDHYGGLQYIARNLHIDNIMITEDFYHNDIWLDLQAFINTEHTVIHPVNDTTHIALNDLKLKIIHPDSRFYSDNPNEMSIVVKLEYDNFSALFTGDIESDSEIHLVAYYPQYLESVLLKVPHHGSRTSSSPPFIQAVNPQFAFIPTDMSSRFNLPHQNTLANLEFLGNLIFISAQDGTLQIKTDGLTATIKAFHSERKISVTF